MMAEKNIGTHGGMYLLYLHINKLDMSIFFVRFNNIFTRIKKLVLWKFIFI